jgi:hypothetical protein
VAVPALTQAPTVWSAPASRAEPGQQRTRDLLLGASFGAVVALLGVLLGAIVTRW